MEEKQHRHSTLYLPIELCSPRLQLLTRLQAQVCISNTTGSPDKKGKGAQEMQRIRLRGPRTKWRAGGSYLSLQSLLLVTQIRQTSLRTQETGLISDPWSRLGDRSPPSRASTSRPERKTQGSGLLGTLRCSQRLQTSIPAWHLQPRIIQMKIW